MIHRLLSTDLTWRLGWALLHSVWQALLVAAITGLLLLLLSRRTANLRYCVACCGMAMMYIPLLVTLALVPPRPARSVAADPDTSIVRPADDGETRRPSTMEPSAAGSQTDVPTPSSHAPTSSLAVEPTSVAPASPKEAAWLWSGWPPLRQVISPWLPWSVAAWLAGVGLLSLWNMGGWIAAQRLRRLAVVPAAEHAQDCLARLAKQMHVNRPVQLTESLLVEVPMAVGWLRPVVLLPASLITGLTPAELDALLAHELAHIRRHDYLVNLLQTLTETLLFYHPAVWLVSRWIRIEREYCCDDAALAACGGKTEYARALAAIERSRTAPGIAMSFCGGRTSMTRNRVQRILGVPPGRRHAWLAGSGAFSLLVVLAFGSAAILAGSDSPLAAQAPPRRAPPESVQEASSLATQPAEKPIEVAWGEAVDGLRTRVSAEKTSFAAGHPIRMKLEISNIGNEVRQYGEHHVSINHHLIVKDGQGQDVPYVRGTAQIASHLVKIEPGQTRVIESFDLAASYYLRRPGRYSVTYRGVRGSKPPSNELAFEVTPDPAATADGDPVGRLLPLVHDRWTLVGAPDATGQVRPGANRREVRGRQIYFQDNPTGLIRDITLIVLWLTDEPAGEVDTAADGWPPASEDLGRVSRWHVYVHAPPEALKRWPKAKEDIKRVLQKESVPEYDYYRSLHDRYKTQILRAAKEGNKDQVSKLTDKFNQSIGGKLLYVRVVRRSGPIDHHSTLLSKFFGEKQISVEKIHYAYSTKPHVGRRKEHVLIETNQEEAGKWPDDVQITLAIDAALATVQLDPVRKPENPAIGKPWRIRLTSSNRTVVFNADGTRRSETELAGARAKPPLSQSSPDGSEITYAARLDGKPDIFIADADGKNPRRLTDDAAIDRYPSWSPDGRRITFASQRTGAWQVYVMDRDGKNVKQLTNEAQGARNPKFGPDGRLAYLAPQGPPKLQPVSLVVASDRESQAIVSGIYISDFAWSPDGNTIAYSTLGTIVFQGLKTGKRKVVVFTDIDKRLSSHTAFGLFWRPDSRAVACCIKFLGGRPSFDDGPEPIFGDDELFTITTDGEITMIKPGKEFMPYGIPTVEWLRGDEK